MEHVASQIYKTINYGNAIKGQTDLCGVFSYMWIPLMWETNNAKKESAIALTIKTSVSI